MNRTTKINILKEIYSKLHNQSDAIDSAEQKAMMLEEELAMLTIDAAPEKKGFLKASIRMLEQFIGFVKEKHNTCSETAYNSSVAFEFGELASSNKLKELLNKVYDLDEDLELTQNIINNIEGILFTHHRCFEAE